MNAPARLDATPRLEDFCPTVRFADRDPNQQSTTRSLCDLFRDRPRHVKDRSNGLTPAGLGWCRLRWPATIELGLLGIKCGRTSVKLRTNGFSYRTMRRQSAVDQRHSREGEAQTDAADAAHRFSLPAVAIAAASKSRSRNLANDFAKPCAAACRPSRSPCQIRPCRLTLRRAKRGPKR